MVVTYETCKEDFGLRKKATAKAKGKGKVGGKENGAENGHGKNGPGKGKGKQGGGEGVGGDEWMESRKAHGDGDENEEEATLIMRVPWTMVIFDEAHRGKGTDRWTDALSRRLTDSRRQTVRQMDRSN